MDYLKEIKQFHAEQVEPYIGKPVGCSQEEIAEFEKKIGYPLPEAYCQFLKWMGKDYRGVFIGCNWFITDVINNTEWLPQFLAKNNIDFKLPEHYLVFFSYRGYIAAWFELPKENDNPTAYFFTESKELTIPSIGEKFTDVLFKDMRDLAYFLPEIHKKKCTFFCSCKRLSDF